MNFKARWIVGFCLWFFCAKAAAIYIFTEGSGTVSPDLTGINLIAGRTYTITAKSRPGYAFDHWNIDEYFASESPKLKVMILNGRFYVEDGTNYLYVGNINTYITAHFLPKSFIPGTYIGLNTDPFTTYSTFRISKGGSFSAKAFFDGKWHSFSGKFSGDGIAHSTLRINGRKVGLNIYFDTDYNQSGYLGLYSEADEYDPDTALNYLGGIPVSHDPRITTYYGGKYTATIAGEDADASIPKGDGFAKISIDRTGHLHAIGKLADGTPFTQSTSVTASPFIQWPLFIVLKKGEEILAGTVEFFLSTGPLGGYVTWEKSAQSNDLYYPQGFRHEFSLNGTGYLAPELRENQLLDCNNIVVSIDGGTLPIHFASTATVTPDYRIVIDDPTNQIAISINITDGLFSGTATPAGQSQPIVFEGALLQHFPDGTLLTGYFGSGFFLQDNLSGRIKIVAAP